MSQFKLTPVVCIDHDGMRLFAELLPFSMSKCREHAEVTCQGFGPVHNVSSELVDQLVFVAVRFRFGNVFYVGRIEDWIHE